MNSYSSGHKLQWLSPLRVLDSGCIEKHALTSVDRPPRSHQEEAAQSARQAEADALAEADKLYTVNHRKTGIPKGANPLHLDLKKLDNLLDPTNIVRDSMLEFEKTLVRLALPPMLTAADVALFTVRASAMRQAALQQRVFTTT